MRASYFVQSLSAYNYFDFNLKINSGKKLQEKRLTENWLYFNYFKTKCEIDHCRKVLSVDGYYKINRLKCLYAECKVITPQ
ncbi:hypothetical protein BpHYR1_052054 [Brachionus plicatilis]|uniref:Uncharacterized protein n=1 Tax=Brachionus plicatilis TaxID=10195 RepID=A0A3M7QMF4_BRAPC|nr:hypothetical protein BpHYR1_052054 [Brachionus plicatilis]